MSQSPPPVAGPSNHGNNSSNTDPSLLRQFVREYLQQHGFDKALAMFDQGMVEGSGGGEDKDADGEEEVVARRGSASGGVSGREAIFRAPGPVALDNAVKRNIPQAQFVSASTMSDRITPEFESQAKYIIDQLTQKAEAQADTTQKGGEEPLLDPSDRIEGYKRYRRWVDDGLDIWKPELDALCFPIFAHTFLDLMQFGFTKTARRFMETHKRHYEDQYPQEVSSLASLSSKHHLEINPYCRQLLSLRYAVKLSRNPHDLLLQWLSGAGLDEEWETGLHCRAGRAKEAVKGIVFTRIAISVTNSTTPLDKVVIASSRGLLPAAVPASASLDTFNAATKLKLGPLPVTEKLKEQVSRELQDAEKATNGHDSPNGGQATLANGHDTNGDVEMGDSTGRDARAPSRDRSMRSPTTHEVKLEPDIYSDKDPDLVSPTEAETHPPIPAVFRLADLKREVEAVRDKRKMIRLGTGDEGKAGTSAVLPSVLAMTVFDGGEGVSSVEFSQDSSLMGVGSSQSCIRLWSMKGEKLKAKTLDYSGQLTDDDGLPVRKLIGHSGPVYSLSFDPIYGSSQPPSTMLSSSQDGTVRLWSLDTYSNLVVYRGHNRDPVWDVEWGPMGVYFASASRDRTAKLWSSDRVAPLRMYTGHLSDVNCVKFHPNSLYLATGSNDNSCRLWDVQRGACIRLFLGHTDAVTTMAISPDGRTLASAGLDSTIWLWDLGSSRPIKKMTGHTSAITSLSFSAESSVLVSGGLDSTVRCWDVKSAGGERPSALSVAANRGAGGDTEGRQRVSSTLGGESHGALPMGQSENGWDENATSDLLATWYTKRTPIVKTHYTPRNLCMVAGAFVPPSSTAKGDSRVEQ